MSLFCLRDIVIAGGQKVLMEVTGSSVLNFNQSSHEIVSSWTMPQPELKTL